ncbi:MAG: cyclic nucleotide-binding domain-containing protein [Oscillospiraceae bacterium]|nr:cyclic nucleotide-binding domain-containing protein [Oscillospiraceae bacterium]
MHRINDDYIRDFFGISADEAGEKELADIKSRLVPLRFDHGQDICTIEGEPDGMFFLESGTAIVLSRDGEQINVMREGQYFGEYAVLARQKRLSTVRSQGRTTVYRLNSGDMMDILSRHPDIYGELMKRVYGQVSNKHTQVIALSRMQRGMLQSPHNQTPMTALKMLVHYGIVALIFAAALLLPSDSAVPLFLVPLAFMIVYAFITRRTVESLVISGMLAAVLVYRSGISAGYTDALMDTMISPDNVFTVLVMALMGAVVTLIEYSGAVTAFRKLAGSRLRSRRGVRLSAVAMMAVTSIDDGLNLLCASAGLRSAADEQRSPREEQALMMSMLPTVLCSFSPLSLWGIFVIGILVPINSGGFGLFCRSIPFNFFSVVALAAMLLFSFGLLPRSGALKKAETRVKAGGELWPAGSERYLVKDETETWGRISNLLIPIAVLALSSVAVRSIVSGSFVVDSACGLMLTLIVMFFLYCSQKLMSPEQFAEQLLNGIESMTLPIVLYLLSICFSTMLDRLEIARYFDGLIEVLDSVSQLIPAMLFSASTLLTVALGSSWSMYAIAFPIALHLGGMLGLSLPLCAGAVCAAGIAGEKLCVVSGDSLYVANAIGCDPKAVLRVRLPYSAAFALISLLMYIAAGLIM